VAPRSRLAISLRILSGLCGAVVLLASAVFTLGTSLAAPLGMFVVRRRAQQRGRPLTRFGSWLGAAIASSIAVAVALLVVFAFIPRSMYQEIQKGAVEARARDTTRTPAWMTKTFPRSARADSTTQQIVNSTAFLVIGGALGLGFACLFFGAISGSVGWVGAVLLGYALTGVAPP
jgi:hypothetical protein